MGRNFLAACGLLLALSGVATAESAVPSETFGNVTCTVLSNAMERLAAARERGDAVSDEWSELDQIEIKVLYLTLIYIAGWGQIDLAEADDGRLAALENKVFAYCRANPELNVYEALWHALKEDEPKRGESMLHAMRRGATPKVHSVTIREESGLTTVVYEVDNRSEANFLILNVSCGLYAGSRAIGEALGVSNNVPAKSKVIGEAMAFVTGATRAECRASVF